MDLKALEANYQPKAMPAARKAPGGIGGLLTNFLPTIAGGAGAVLGTIAGPAGTVAGGALGSGLGEFLRQKLTGEADDGIDKGNLVQEGLFGALPGIGKGVKALNTARKGVGGLEAAGGLRGVLTGAKVADTASDASRVMSGVDEIAGGAKVVKGAQSTEEALTMRSKLAKAGTSLRQDVVNPKVAAGVGGAQKEADIAARVSRVPGLSAKGKYQNLAGEMKTISAKIEPELAKAKGTVASTDVLTSIRNNAEQSSHFLAGDPTYEKQLSSVLGDLSAKTGGAEKLTAAQMYDYKKGMDMTSVFNKLEKGADLNPKEAARLSVWSSLDDNITKAAPSVKALTQEQSLLIKGAPGLKKASEKTFGIPLLGVKSRKAEQAMQAGRELVGRGAQAVGGAGVPSAGRPFMGAAGQVAKASVPQAGYRVGASMFTGNYGANEQPQTPDTAMPDPMLDTGMDVAPQAPQTSDSPFSPDNLEANVQKILAGGGTMKDVSEYLSIAKTMGDLSPKAGKPLSSEAAKTLSNAEAGLTAIDDFESAISQDPGAFARTNIPGMGVLDSITGGRVGGAMGTSGIDAASQQIVDVIARLRTGAAISKTEEARFKKFIPLPGDPENVRAQKTAYLRDQFQRVASRVQNSPQQDLETVSVGQ